MFAIMLSWPTPPMRRPKKQRQGSIHGLTRTKTTRNQIENRCTRHANDKQPMWRPHCNDSGPKPTWWHTFWGRTGVSTIQDKNENSVVSSHHTYMQIAGASLQAWRPDQPLQYKKKTMWQCKQLIHILTRMENHTYTLCCYCASTLAVPLLTRIYVNSVNMSAIMAAGHTTPKRSQIQQHRSINAHTKEKNHRLRSQKSQDNVCKRFAQPTTLATTLSRLCTKAILLAPILALQHWNYIDSCKKKLCALGIQHLRGSLGHVRNHGGSCHQSERHPSNHLLARAENHKHTEHNLHVATYNKIAQPYIVPNTSWRLKTKATVVALILTIRSLNVLDTCASTRVVSLPSEFLVTCSQSCRQDNPLKCGPEFNNDTNRWTQSPERKNTSIRSKYRSARRAKDFQHWPKCQTHHGQ